MAKLSVVIPARNEQFLNKTISDLLTKATQELEIIVVLDGYWPEVIQDSRVIYIHFSDSVGMRACINAGVAVAKGEYILKTDAHCMFAKGFDEALKADCEDNWVVIPRRLRLEPESWTLRDVGKPAMDYMFLTYPDPTDLGAFGGPSLQGREWRERNIDESLKSKLIDDCMTFQGSAWFMKKSYFEWLELMDQDTYGEFMKEAQEIGLKCWLSGGRVVRNKKTWYAHLHKGKKYGRGYPLSKKEVNKGTQAINKWVHSKQWRKQVYPLSYLIRKFPDCPQWTEERIQEAEWKTE